jgi:Tol biopolymer transport system component
MLRQIAVLLVIVLAACTPGTTTVSGSPTQAASSADPTAEPVTASPSPSQEPTAAPSVSAGHPAEGLAFVPLVNDDPTTQVWVIEADGTPRQVTGVSGQLGASHPVWSRDGSQLAFSGQKVGEVGIGGQVGIVNADGSNEREVAAGQLPEWSPDGTRIAFTEVDDVTGEELSMYVVDVATGDIRDLGIGYGPRWIDDGTLVFNANVFAPDGSARLDAFLLDLESGERQPLAEGTIAYPSPDGTMLLLEQDGTISLAAADGSGPVELVTGFTPVWSPDGTRFAFAYEFDSNANAIQAIVDLDGKTIASEIRGSSPAWSPDGTRVAVHVFLSPTPLVQVIDVASGDVLWEEVGGEPAWRP